MINKTGNTDTNLACNLLARLNEALSAREVLRVAQSLKMDIRRTQTDPSYASPITDDQLLLWLDRSTLVMPIHDRINDVLGKGKSVATKDFTHSFVHIGGPSGGGKTTFALELALEMGAPIVDGDALHTQEAVDIMHNDGKLTDEYRMGEWLPRLCDVLLSLHAKTGMPVAYVCSALSEQVRKELRAQLDIHPSIYCYAPYEELKKRLQHRVHPYIQADSPGFLDGQWNGWTATLESISNDPYSLALDTTRPTAETFAEAGEFIR